MNKYECPEVIIALFESEDVITTSIGDNLVSWMVGTPEENGIED